MVVDAKYVGAIIGQQGNNIREITRESKAKCIVDSQKGGRDSQGITEKVKDESSSTLMNSMFQIYCNNQDL